MTRFQIVSVTLLALGTIVSTSAASAAGVDVDVTIDSATADVQLGCTWTTPPPSADSRWPAAALLTVAGPDDRHQTVGPHRLFADLAHGLAARGIATLRCDDRGIGESGGDWLEASYDLRSRDALQMGRVDPTAGGASPSTTLA